MTTRRSPDGFVPIGFGCYRVTWRVEEHALALKEAILNGIRLIDNSANYGDGEAEELVGRVLKELEGEGKVTREDVLLVSKFGYIQGQNLKRHDGGLTFPETVDFGPHLKHCIHPEFMRDQLQRSLDRLQTTYLDVYLLHNPEYYLQSEKTDQQSGAKPADVVRARNEMLRRVEQVFEALEEEVQSGGRLQSYGISSNSFSVDESDPTFLPYQDLIERATRASIRAAERLKKAPPPSHSFSTIQLPGNLVETTGLDNAVKWAHHNHLRVLINRPLNAFTSTHAWRLADQPDPAEAYRDNLRELKKYLGELGKGDPQKAIRYREVVREVEGLEQGVWEVGSVFEWEQRMTRHILPSIRRAVGHSGVGELGLLQDSKCLDMLQRFVDTLDQRVRFVLGQRTRSDMASSYQHNIPAEQPMQEYCIRWLLDQPGVSYVLLGARKREYVHSALKACRT
ncbi:unnamed protein product [Vitrella brassicaformis CCMP3155]|uniref:NADP-dependent oxidoreductase domain-containing protein n=1 Tax=Vitrella brassicaformis (strain CCMP3155) TaxID=1169540 RepID=A0A0G4EW99_VITBC|nr:unnamed protein product [Vitrella brassicaformis CCMP3155]|eukprot:CEM02733.1 unnamed protein product [Vitrella brassicaformis CCMP3155]